MAKKKEIPRGATPLVTREKRQWQLTLPSVPWQWIVLPLLVAGVIAGGRWAYQSWPITGVEISGRLTVWKAEDVAAKISWVKDENFFSLDPQQVYQDVATMPLIRQVVVRKRWPGTVELTLTEDLPMAVMNGNKLLSVSGVISDIPAGLSTEGLAHIDGDETQAETAIRYFRRIQQSLNGRELKIDQLAVNATGAVTVDLSNGWKIHFGRQYFEERIQRLAILLAKLPPEAVDSLDLRYGKGAAIRWRSVQEMG
ncbi:MAG: FtsQ-type POTRA domain-containing protein [Pseudomonadota bacterium]|nr:FtsQ-type POTRA domain-containing protein [Pseudomonadota bacterium]